MLPKAKRIAVRLSLGGPARTEPGDCPKASAWFFLSASARNLRYACDGLGHNFPRARGSYTVCCARRWLRRIHGPRYVYLADRDIEAAAERGGEAMAKALAGGDLVTSGNGPGTDRCPISATKGCAKLLPTSK